MRVWGGCIGRPARSCARLGDPWTRLGDPWTRLGDPWTRLGDPWTRQRVAIGRRGDPGFGVDVHRPDGDQVRTTQLVMVGAGRRR
jgi:hypothetical protein